MAISHTVITQYTALKTETADCVLLMQVGVFMHVFNEDARTVSQVTGLKLRMAGDVDAPVVVGGFPVTGLDAYVGRLVRAGHSVAIAMQDEHKARRITEVIRVQGTHDGTL